MEKLSALDCGVESAPILLNTFSFLADDNNISALNKGDTLFSFCCKVGDQMNEDEKLLVDLIINLSSFKDEEKENNAPRVDIFDDNDAKQYTIILTHVAYLLPKVRVDHLSPDFFSMYEYQSACQPGNPVIWKDVNESQTFRFTKTIVPYVFKITVQLKASSVDKDTRVTAQQRLDKQSGCSVDHGLLLERTKRNVEVVDATRKVKSALFYTKIDGGLLVRHLTVVINTTIPSYGAWAINNLGSFGSGEAAQTATLTRKALTRMLLLEKDPFPRLAKKP